MNSFDLRYENVIFKVIPHLQNFTLTENLIDIDYELVMNKILINVLYYLDYKGWVHVDYFSGNNWDDVGGKHI